MISFTIIDIQTVGDKRSIGGYGTYPIQTEYSSSNPSPVENIDNVESIIIKTNYPTSWNNFISKTLINSGLELNTNFSIYKNKNEVKLEFNNVFPKVNIQVVNINAQIAPGWIENVKGA